MGAGFVLVVVTNGEKIVGCRGNEAEQGKRSGHVTSLVLKGRSG